MVGQSIPHPRFGNDGNEFGSKEYEGEKSGGLECLTPWMRKGENKAESQSVEDIRGEARVSPLSKSSEHHQNLAEDLGFPHLSHHDKAGDDLGPLLSRVLAENHELHPLGDAVEEGDEALQNGVVHRAAVHDKTVVILELGVRPSPKKGAEN